MGFTNGLLVDIQTLKEENERLQSRIDEILSYIPEVGESSYAKVVKENELLKDSTAIAVRLCELREDRRRQDDKIEILVKENTLLKNSFDTKERVYQNLLGDYKEVRAALDKILKK